MNKFLKLNPLYVIRYMVLSAIFLLPPLTTRADSITSTLALQQVAKYSGNWTSSPTNWNGGSTTDGPLLGNGNVGVIVFNSIHNMSFLLDKNEFWSLGKETKYDMAEMYLHVPGMNGSSYSVQQNIATATVTGTFTLSGNTVKTTSWVQATDATNNLLITQLVYSGSSSNDATVSFVPGFANSFPNDHGTSGNVVYFDIAGDSTTTVGGFATCQVRCAATVIGATPSISNNQFTFTMQPGNTYTVVACIMSNYDSPSWQSLAISNISSLNSSNISSDLSSHEAWWSSFYGKSYVTLPDQTAEKEYYGSLYILASASRTGHAPPGIWGPWTIAGSSGVPLWDGDFHCNYDYEVPYLGMLAANHPELLDSYSTPVLNWIPNGQAAASSFGYSGVYIPSGIGPLPLGSTFSQPGGFNADPFLNQKLDAVFLAEPMIATFYRTRSTSYARTILPYLEQCAAFWTNYLVSNGTSYDDFNDAQHEHDAYPQTDGCCSLGLIHYLFQGAIDVANFLNKDASLVPTWTNYNNTLAPYPTFIHNNQTCFRATLVGRDWSTTNDCELRFIYPGDQVGLLSSPSLLSTAYNTVSQYAAQGEWTDTNATPTFYPMCARVGFPASTILSELDSWITSKAYPSMTIGTFGGGMENENTTTACLTEMMMQSFQGTILIFPDWPAATSAQFGDLLAKGDFLISSSYQNGAVQYVRIISQAGQTAVIQNPWPGQTLAFYKNGSSAGTLSGTDISISTSTGDVDYIALNGTSYGSIITAISTNNGSVGPGSTMTEPCSTLVESNTAGLTYSQVPGGPNGEIACKLYSTAVGQFLQFTVTGIVQGTSYDVTIGYKSDPTRGQCQLSINGNTQSQLATLDEYEATSTWNRTADLGTFFAGSAGTTRTFTFTVSGKNSAATGYTMAPEWIALTPL